MTYKKIILKKGKEDSLRRFHPWIFSGAIQSVDENVEEGDKVSVYTADGSLIGNGHFQTGSICVRMLTWNDDAVDEKFYQDRLRAAMELRRGLKLVRDNNNSFRLVHGEGDFLPGLVIDIYGSTAVLQAHSPGVHFDRKEIANALIQLQELAIKNVYYKSETTLPYKADLEAENGYIVGNFDTDVATENGLLFHVDWLRGQKTGFFVDQRDNRSLLEHYSQGRRVLNMFCYTGGFSVYAMRGGAETVHSVDSSSKAIHLTNENVALNYPNDNRHEAFAEDAFKYLANMEYGQYDLIVLDPPAFAKHKSALKNALVGYRRLNGKAFEKIAAGGILFTFSCSQAVSREQFRFAVLSAAVQSRRKVRILHQLSQSADHPINIYHPEGEYLKGLVLYVE